MQINNNREMRALEDHRKKCQEDLAAADCAYVRNVSKFHLCPESLGKIQWGYRCPVECGQCQGTGWVKK